MTNELHKRVEQLVTEIEQESRRMLWNAWEAQNCDIHDMLEKDADSGITETPHVPYTADDVDNAYHAAGYTADDYHGPTDPYFTGESDTHDEMRDWTDPDA